MGENVRNSFVVLTGFTGNYEYAIEKEIQERFVLVNKDLLGVVNKIKIQAAT